VAWHIRHTSRSSANRGSGIFGVIAKLKAQDEA